jgi:hypothetical protein
VQNSKKSAIKYDTKRVYNILINNYICAIEPVGVDRDAIPRGIVGKYMLKKVDIFTFDAIYIRTGHANQLAAERDYPP